MSQITDLIEIRPAFDDEGPRLDAIAKAAYGPFQDRVGVTPAPLLENYSDRIQTAQVDVLCVGSEPLGFLITVVRPDALLLENIAILPEQQGKGHGRRLMAQAEERARHADRTRIDLYTHVKMRENRALYAHHGFVEVGERTEQGLERVYMSKSL